MPLWVELVTEYTGAPEFAESLGRQLADFCSKIITALEAYRIPVRQQTDWLARRKPRHVRPSPRDVGHPAAPTLGRKRHVRPGMRCPSWTPPAYRPGG